MFPARNPRSRWRCAHGACNLKSAACSAVATASPPALSFSWPLNTAATSYSVYRRLAGAPSWIGPTVVPGGSTATGWTDTNVTLGTRYEYWFLRGGSPQAKGFLTAGIEAALVEDRGAVVLLVDAAKVAVLGARLDRATQLKTQIDQREDEIRQRAAERHITRTSEALAFVETVEADPVAFGDSLFAKFPLTSPTFSF